MGLNREINNFSQRRIDLTSLTKNEFILVSSYRKGLTHAQLYNKGIMKRFDGEALSKAMITAVAVSAINKIRRTSIPED